MLFLEDLDIHNKLKLVDKLYDILTALVVLNDVFESNSAHIDVNLLHLSKKIIIKMVKNQFMLIVDRDTLSIVDEMNKLIQKKNDLKCKCKCKRKHDDDTTDTGDTDCGSSVFSSDC
jgi:hypothetical protein